MNGSVYLDLNGFTIVGSNLYSQGSGCTAPSFGHHGVRASAGSSSVVVSNGQITGMGAHGVQLLGASSRVERVIAKGNCGTGITVGFASLVIDSVSRSNGTDGFNADRSSFLRDVVADQNGANGIAGYNGDLTIDGCVANANVQNGIVAFPRTLVRGCTARGASG